LRLFAVESVAYLPVMSVKIKSRHRRFCHALFEESIDRPTPCWVSIDKLARLLGVSHEAGFVLAYDCEEAGLVRYHQSEAMPTARPALEVPHSVCLTAEGWRLMRKLRPREGGRQAAPEPRRRRATD
jgi:hypothetical protein